MPQRPLLLRRVAVAAVFTAGVLSWFASSQPDGLEWALAHAADPAAPASPLQGAYATPGHLQQRTAVLSSTAGSAPSVPDAAGAAAAGEPANWPDVNAATSLSGLMGGLITLVVVAAVGLGLRRRRSST